MNPSFETWTSNGKAKVTNHQAKRPEETTSRNSIGEANGTVIMYTPPAISPQVTPRSSESQASDEEEEEEDDDDETYHDANLGFRGGGGGGSSAVGDSGGTTVPSSVASSAAVPMADESTETADRSTTTATTPTSTTTAATTTTTTMAHAATSGGGGSSSMPVVPPSALSHGGTSTAGGGNTPLLAAAVEPDPAPVVVSASNLDAWKKNYREVAHTSAAVCWELSSSKPGNGVEQLRDASNETYWQSDGTTQPHWVQITFRRRLPIVYVALYLDIALDESYTPKTLSVETGMTAQDLSASPANMKMELTDPSGWSVIAISGPPDPLTMDTTVKTHLIRINILSMHQNGRDTHIRRLAIFAKRTMPPMAVQAQQQQQPAAAAAAIPSSQRPLSQRNKMMRGDDGNDDDDDDTNLLLNSDFGGPFSMLIR